MFCVPPVFLENFMNWIISVVGAFDRFNYGDILFPRIAEHMIASEFPDANLEYFALRAADLRPEGGVVTRPLRDLYARLPAKDQYHLILLAGGELLAPAWHQMAEHLMPNAASSIVRRIQRRTPGLPWNSLWRRLYHCPNLQPWTIDPNDMPTPERCFVAYNAVGGTSVNELSEKELSWQTHALAQATWLSVRDEPTAATIRLRGLPAPHVVPDSAVVMDALCSSKEIAALGAAMLARANLPAAPYLCIQMAKRWIEGHEQTVANQLEEVNRRTGLNIVALAIGRAAGHEDQISARRLQNRLGDRPWFGLAPDTMSVQQIMATIAGSKLYVGSSLHGYITAFAFGRGRIGLLSHLTKVTGFRDAWDHPAMPTGIALDQIADNVDMVLKNRQNWTYGHADKIYRQSFSEMARILKQKTARRTVSED